MVRATAVGIITSSTHTCLARNGYQPVAVRQTFQLDIGFT